MGTSVGVQEVIHQQSWERGPASGEVCFDCIMTTCSEHLCIRASVHDTRRESIRSGDSRANTCMDVKNLCRVVLQ